MSEMYRTTLTWRRRRSRYYPCDSLESFKIVAKKATVYLKTYRWRTEPPTVTCWETINGENVFSTFYQHGAT